MNILLVNNVCATGGIESQMAMLAKCLISRGHFVSTFFYSGKSGKHFFEGICDVNVGNEISLAEVLLKHDYDVIHTNIITSDIGFFGTIDKIGFTGRIIATCHGNIPMNFPYDRESVDITAVSKYLANEIYKHCGKKPKIIYNSVDIRIFNPNGKYIESDRPVLMWVGRSHDSDKDFPGFVFVASKAVDLGWNIWVVDGCDNHSYNTLDTWLGSRCFIFRNLPSFKIAEVYRGAGKSGGCLISTSQREAFGIAAGEAIACGCPVLVPNVGGLPEVVEDGNGGFIYKRESAFDDIENLLTKISEDNTRSNLISRGIKRIQQEFAIDSMTDGYEELYSVSSKNIERSINSLKKNVLRAGISLKKIFEK